MKNVAASVHEFILAGCILTIAATALLVLSFGGIAGAQDAGAADRLVLVGVVLGHAGGPIAVIEDLGTGQERLYHIGADIRGLTVRSVTADRAVIGNPGHDVELRLGVSRHPGPLPARAVQLPPGPARGSIAGRPVYHPWRGR